LVRANFAWFHNWDHQMQAMRRRHQLVSLTPLIARTKHVGLKGVNFNLDSNDPSVKKWLDVYIPGEIRLVFLLFAAVMYSDCQVFGFLVTNCNSQLGIFFKFFRSDNSTDFSQAVPVVQGWSEIESNQADLTFP
jgi:hypothetical protein